MFNLLGMNFAHTTSSHTRLTKSLFTKLDWRSPNFDKCDNMARNFNIDDLFTERIVTADRRWSNFKSMCQHGTVSVAVTSCPPTANGDPTSAAQSSIFCTPSNRVIAFEGNLYAALDFGLRLASAQSFEEIPFCGEGDFGYRFFNVTNIGF